MNRNMRLGTDDYFMKIANVVSERSTCLRNKVGAVLVRDKYIVATGYNGPPRGLSHCEKCKRDGFKSGEKHELSRAVHAEQNVIIQAALHGVSPDGSTLYCTHFPCTTCLRMLINAGVKKVFYEAGYDMDNPVKKELVEESGIDVEQLKVNGGPKPIE